MRLGGDEVFFYTCPYCNKTEFTPKSDYDLPPELSAGETWNLKLNCEDTGRELYLEFSKECNIKQGTPSKVLTKEEKSMSLEERLKHLMERKS